MESFKKFLNNILYPTSLIYTVISALFFIASKYTLGGDTTTATLMLVILVFSLVHAYFLGVFRTKLPYVVRTLIHYAIVTGSLLILFTIAGSAFSPSSVILILSFFTVVYFVIAVPVLIVLYKRKAKENEAKEYKSSFSGKR